MKGYLTATGFGLIVFCTIPFIYTYVTIREIVKIMYDNYMDVIIETEFQTQKIFESYENGND